MARRNGTVGTSRGFLQAVNKWTRETEERSEEAFQNGLLNFHDELARETPVLTGNLRNSLVASVNSEGLQQVVTGPGTGPQDDTYRGGAEASIAAIMRAKIGDRVSFLYGAPYARRQNNGFTGTDSLGRSYSQPGKFWIERVGAQYRSIMRAAATALRMQSK